MKGCIRFWYQPDSRMPSVIKWICLSLAVQLALLFIGRDPLLLASFSFHSFPFSRARPPRSLSLSLFFAFFSTLHVNLWRWLLLHQLSSFCISQFSLCHPWQHMQHGIGRRRHKTKQPNDETNANDDKITTKPEMGDLTIRAKPFRDSEVGIYYNYVDIIVKRFCLCCSHIVSP